MATIDHYSCSTIPIEMYFDETPLSIGTAFLWHSRGRYFLVTNWHNVTGKSPTTGKHLSKTAAEPNRLRVWLHHSDNLNELYVDMLDLRDPRGHPRWWIHPTLHSQVDVVAIPIVTSDSLRLFAINELPSRDLMLKVGMDVFILGYPFGIGTAGFPIWKRGSIASEPEILSEEQRFIFVDSASRPGMSGSPVIRRSWGTHFLKDGGVEMAPRDATMFIGIYSGRLTTNDPNDAQLGMTWPASLIQEIVDGGTCDGS